MTQVQQSQPSPFDQLVNLSAYPRHDFAFADFLKREYDFSLEPNRPICKAHLQGLCPLGQKCPDKHPHQSNYTNLICKHWLRGLCKKGAGCEFLHEYNLRLMPECTQYSRYLTCTNGSDCLYLHVDPAMKRAPCPHYERGFCPLGPYCAARHIKRKMFCRFYMAGFCPNGKGCEEGAHPLWKENDALPKPEVKKILSKEEQEAERQKLVDRLEKEREDEERDREERGLPQRRDYTGRGRGRGQWRGRSRGNRY